MSSVIPQEYATLSFAVDAKEFKDKPYVIPEKPLNDKWHNMGRVCYEQQWMERKAVTKEMYEVDMRRVDNLLV